MVLHPRRPTIAAAIFRKWGLDFAVIGKTTDTKRFVIRHGGEVKADLPIKELGDEAPLYDRPWTPTPPRRAARAPPSVAPHAVDPRGAAEAARLARSRLERWVYEQYDSLILGNTVSGRAATRRSSGSATGPKGLALTTDVTERYCEADPVEGGKQAVAEAWRNLVAVGARPLALTDNLNFGNPEKPHAMGQFVGCLARHRRGGARARFPDRFRQRVALQRDDGRRAFCRRPSIGGVGLCPDVAKAARAAFRREGDAILLIGGAPGWLGRSAWLAICRGPRRGRAAAGRSRRRAAQRRIRAGRRSGRAGSIRVHDLSDGGPRRRARRNGDRRRDRRARSTRRASSGPSTASFSARTRAAMSSRRRAETAAALIARSGRRAALPCRGSARSAATRSTLPGADADRGRRAARGVRILVSRAIWMAPGG